MKIYPTRFTSGKNKNLNRKLLAPSMQGIRNIQKSNLKDYKKTAGYGATALSLFSGLCYLFKSKRPTEYMKALAKSMSIANGQNIKPNNLASIMSGDELFSILPQLKKENYVYNS